MMMIKWTNFFNLRALFLCAFIVLNFLDLVVTMIIKFTKPVFNEFNVVYHWLGFWPMVLVKVAFVVWLVFLMGWCYRRLEFSTLRYILVWYVVLVCVILVPVVIGNFEVLFTPNELMQQIPDDVLAVQQYETVGNLSRLRGMSPGTTTPLIVLILGINLIQFMVWHSFEKNTPPKFKKTWRKK